MERPIITRVVAIAFSVVAAGCAYMTNPWAKQESSPPVNSNQAHQEERNDNSHSNTSKRPSTKKASARHAVSPSAAAATPAPMTVTLADEEAKGNVAEKLLNDSDTRLAKIDRASLSGEDASIYQQAAGLVSAARRALGERDYLAASELAEKASVLTLSISSNTPAR